MRTALSERPVRGTIACVCLVNETQKTLEVNKMDGFNFLFELNAEFGFGELMAWGRV